MSNADLVAEFHRLVDSPGPGRPTVPDLQLLELRRTLIQEEFAEVIEEFDRLAELIRSGRPDPEDLTGVAHELADLLYVVYGAFAAFGLPADDIVGAVHAANLSKVSGPTRADGKKLKPPGWQPAEVAGRIRAAAGDD